MIVLVVLLAVTNIATIAALVILARRRLEPETEADPAVATALAGARPRQVISVEVLNPVEVVANRNRLVGFAGAFVPRLTQRVVADQVLRAVRQELSDEQIAADVRLHRIAPAVPPGVPAEPAVVLVDEVAPVNFDDPRGG